MRIQHNITALNAYRNLTNNNSAVAKNLEKLSSGYKINRAGDDAAGLAISEKMRAQITGLKTAQKNANDGISLIQTAEGALTEVHSMLNRMVELANQSANGTYQDEDRANLQAEVDALRDEINRISEGTNFNGIQLLDGSMEQKVVSSGDTDLVDKITQIKDGQLGKTPQAGQFSIDLSNATLVSPADGTDMEFSIFNAKVTVGTGMAKGASMTGADAAAKIAEEWNKLATDERTVAGAVISASNVGSKVIFTMDKAPNEEWKTGATGIGVGGGTIQADTNFVTQDGNQAEQLAVTVLKEPVDTTAGREYGQASFELSDVEVADGRTLTIGDTTYVFAVGPNSQYANKANAINLTDMSEADAQGDKIHVVAMRLSEAAKDNKNFKVGTDTITGRISLTEKEGGVDYKKNNLEGEKANNGTDADADTDGNWEGLVKVGTMDVAASQDGLTLQIGDTSDDYNKMTVSVGNMNAEALGLGDIDVSTQAGAASAVDSIKAAINKVSTQRGSLGALQNRLEHTINSLSVTTENMTAAESRIRDVDMAEEMMAYTKNNILVQASQAMLAQANQIPQGVLQLLQ